MGEKRKGDTHDGRKRVPVDVLHFHFHSRLGSEVIRGSVRIEI